MRILVTGATGLIGYEVSRQLAKAGLRPRLVVRRPIRGALVARLPAEIIAADLTSPKSLARAVEGTEAIIHLGARASFESYGRLRATIVDGSRLLMQAAADAGVQRFVYSSSMFVYPSTREIITRETKPDPVLDYGRAKLESERILAEEASKAGISLISIRLPHVYGARDLFFQQLSRSRGLFLLPGHGRNCFSRLHVADAARVCIAAAQSSVEGAWPIGDKQPTSWDEYFAVLKEHYPQTRPIALPVWFARLGAEMLRPFLWFRKSPSVKTPGTVIGWNLHMEIDPDSLWPELGVEPLYPRITDGIPAALDECVAYRWIHPMEDRSGW